jgi:hypothetical protein
VIKEGFLQSFAFAKENLRCLFASTSLSEGGKKRAKAGGRRQKRACFHGIGDVVIDSIAASNNGSSLAFPSDTDTTVDTDSESEDADDVSMDISQSSAYSNLPITNIQQTCIDVDILDFRKLSLGFWAALIQLQGPSPWVLGVLQSGLQDSFERGQRNNSNNSNSKEKLVLKSDFVFGDWFRKSVLMSWRPYLDIQIWQFVSGPSPSSTFRNGGHEVRMTESHLDNAVVIIGNSLAMDPILSASSSSSSASASSSSSPSGTEIPRNPPRHPQMLLKRHPKKYLYSSVCRHHALCFPSPVPRYPNILKALVMSVGGVVRDSGGESFGSDHQMRGGIGEGVLTFGDANGGEGKLEGGFLGRCLERCDDGSGGGKRDKRGGASSSRGLGGRRWKLLDANVALQLLAWLDDTPAFLDLLASFTPPSMNHNNINHERMSLESIVERKRFLIKMLDYVFGFGSLNLLKLYLDAGLLVEVWRDFVWDTRTVSDKFRLFKQEILRKERGEPESSKEAVAGVDCSFVDKESEAKMTAGSSFCSWMEMNRVDSLQTYFTAVYEASESYPEFTKVLIQSLPNLPHELLWSSQLFNQIYQPKRKQTNPHSDSHSEITGINFGPSISPIVQTLEIMFLRGNRVFCEALFEAGFLRDPGCLKNAKLYEAIRMSDVEMVRFLLETCKVDPMKYYNPSSSPPLSASERLSSAESSTRHHHLETITKLFKTRIDPSTMRNIYNSYIPPLPSQSSSSSSSSINNTASSYNLANPTRPHPLVLSAMFCHRYTLSAQRLNSPLEDPGWVMHQNSKEVVRLLLENGNTFHLNNVNLDLDLDMNLSVENYLPLRILCQNRRPDVVKMCFDELPLEVWGLGEKRSKEQVLEIRNLEEVRWCLESAERYEGTLKEMFKMFYPDFEMGV